MIRTAVALSASLALVGCSSTSTSIPNTTASEVRPQIVVTYSVLGSLVTEIVGSAADVTIVIPDGQDPHDFEPSAKDIETINEADLVVANGLGFEEGLVDAIDAAHDRGVERFLVSDYVTTRTGGTHSHGDEEGHSDEEAVDPHLWLSPFAMSEMVDDLGQAIASATGLDVSASVESTLSSLRALDELIASRIDSLEQCVLVSGHDELGYFADRYGCEVIGAVIPSFSTTAEASAGELATLKEIIQAENVPTIFTGLGTSSDVVDRLTSELGVRAVELATHYLDGAQTYDEFMQRLVDQVVTGLS